MNILTGRDWRRTVDDMRALYDDCIKQECTPHQWRIGFFQAQDLHRARMSALHQRDWQYADGWELPKIAEWLGGAPNTIIVTQLEDRVAIVGVGKNGAFREMNIDRRGSDHTRKDS